jgi:hypothetical protein
MKHIIFLAAALMFAGCSSAKKDHHHDHAHHGEHKEGKSDCGCADGSGHHEHGDEHGATEAKATEAAAWNLAGNPQLKAEISEENFNKMYEAKKTQLGKKCSNAASEYCGKTTKDLAVTKEEVACLWTKAHRVTREVLSQLDKSPCDKILKKMK